MFELLRRFFTDEQAFLRALSIGGARLWIILVALSGIVATGLVPDLTAALGKAGSWGSSALLLLGLVRAMAAAKTAETVAKSAETPPAAKALSYIDPEQLKEVLRQLGVPHGVAETAGDKTAEQPLPKV